MNSDQAFTFDFYDLADTVLAQLTRDVPVPNKKLTHAVVANAIYTWLDGYYLRSVMRWCDTPHDGLDQFVKALGVVTTEQDLRDTPYDFACESLSDGLDEMFRKIIGGRTWGELTVNRVSTTAFTLCVGQDYRITYYMKNVHNARKPKQRQSQTRVSRKASIPWNVPSPRSAPNVTLSVIRDKPKFDNIPQEIVTKTFFSIKKFPRVGDPAITYRAADTKLTYNWVEDAYVKIEEWSDA
jgi:hypothetical protein